MPIQKIISGGQTGSDRGGLEAAIHCRIPHGGWCPKGRKAEDGTIPADYQLREMTTSDYLARTEANVVDSDATLVCTYGRPSGGSLRTLEFASKHGKPWHHVDLAIASRATAVKGIVRWLRGEENDLEAVKPTGDLVFNVAGSRESKAKGIEDRVKVILVDVLIQINSECKRFYPLQ